MGDPTKSSRLPLYTTFLAETTLKSSIGPITVTAGRGKLLTRIDEMLKRYDEECRSTVGWASLEYKKVRLQALLLACKAWLDDPKKATKTTQNHASRKAAIERLANTAWDEYKLQIYEGRKRAQRQHLAGGSLLQTHGMVGVYAKEAKLLDRSKRTAISLTTAKAVVKDPVATMEVQPADLAPEFRRDFDQLSEQDLRNLIQRYGERMIEHSESPYVAYLSKGQRIHYAMVVVEKGVFYCDFTTPFSTIELQQQSVTTVDAAGKQVRRALEKWEIGFNRWVYALDGYGNLFVLHPDVFRAGGRDPSLPAVQQAGAKQLKDVFGESTRINHSTFLAGREVACAGEIVVDGGKLLYVSNASGHYAPDVAALGQLLRYFRDEGVEFNKVVVGVATKDDIRHVPASELL